MGALLQLTEAGWVVHVTQRGCFVCKLRILLPNCVCGMLQPVQASRML